MIPARHNSAIMPPHPYQSYTRPGDGKHTHFVSFTRSVTSILESFGPFDAICIAVKDQFVVTTPNVNFIPHLMLGPSTLQLRKDGRFGRQDPTLLPQRHSNKFSQSCFILRRPPATHPLSVL